MHQIRSKNTTPSWNLCFASFCVKNSLFPNYKAILLSGAFCFKSTQRIQLVVENCVSLHFMWKSSFCYIIMISCKNTTRCWKLCFSSVCVKNSLFPNYKDILLKGAFCIKSTQRIQLAVENCVPLHFVLKTPFYQIIRISYWKVPFAWNLLKEYKSLLKTVFHFILCS